MDQQELLAEIKALERAVLAAFGQEGLDAVIRKAEKDCKRGGIPQPRLYYKSLLQKKMATVVSKKADDKPVVLKKSAEDYKSPDEILDEIGIF